MNNLRTAPWAYPGNWQSLVKRLLPDLVHFKAFQCQPLGRRQKRPQTGLESEHTQSAVQPAMPLRPAPRTAHIAPFHVMELVKQAKLLEDQGRSIIHLSIGEPDFTTPQPVMDALQQAVAAGGTGYTAALGIMELRQAIAGFYRDRHGVAVPPERIMVTAGASGALLLTAAALVGAGDEVLMPDPSYPCNRHFVSAFDGIARAIPCGAAERYQLTAAMVEQHWGPNTRGVLIASPSNPTGTTIAADELADIIDVAGRKGGFVIVDEIYLGLSYEEGGARSVLERPAALAADHVIVINSFSKYFNMTGWRLGWLVTPPALLPVLEKLAQNLFICPSALAQRAALACFAPATLAIYEARKAEFKQRRDFIVPALRAIGFDIPVFPDGAFYVYADGSRFLTREIPDSHALALHILEQVGVSVVPGKDFGDHQPERWLRFTYANSMANLRSASERLAGLLKPG